MNVIEKILYYSDSYNALKRKVKIEGNKLQIGNDVIITRNPLLISVGKSAVKMAKFFIENLNVNKGIIIPPLGSPIENVPLEVFPSTHPDITERSIEAGKRVIEVLKSEDYDLLLFLISGGASALLEYSDVPLDVLKEVNKKLVTSGLSIDEINVVRKHLSLIKGGWLAQYSKSPILTLVVSDVPGGDLSTVGSGPTLLDRSTRQEAENILRMIGLDKYVEYLKETPKDIKVKTFTYKILDVEEVLLELKRELNGEIISSEVRGDAFSFGVQLAGIANTLSRLGEKKTLLFGGEPEVKISGKYGKGGRNGEVCLGFLKYVRSNSVLYAIATDGIDGNSEYAGCVVESSLKIESIEIDNAVRTHSSYELLEKYGVTVKTGYTGDNVNNVYLLEIV